MKFNIHQQRDGFRFNIYRLPSLWVQNATLANYQTLLGTK